MEKKTLSPRQGSIIDYPHESLPEDIWDQPVEGEYVMKPQVKEEIVSIVEEVLDSHFSNKENWWTGLLFGSSAGTQFYSGDVDLDFKIIINYERFLADNPKYEHLYQSDEKAFQKELVKTVRDKEYEIKGHPVDLYVYNDQEWTQGDFLNKYDSLYMVFSPTGEVEDNWIKAPKLVNVDEYDRSEVVGRGKDMALKWAKEWDLSLGQIRRSVIEYEMVREYLNKLTPEEQEKFKEEVEKILIDLEKDIQELAEQKQFITEERHRVFDEPFTPDIENYYYSINFLPENIQFKLLQRYGYLGIISSLGELLDDDGKIDDQEVDSIKDQLGG